MVILAYLMVTLGGGKFSSSLYPFKGLGRSNDLLSNFDGIPDSLEKIILLRFKKKLAKKSFTCADSKSESPGLGLLS